MTAMPLTSSFTEADRTEQLKTKTIFVLSYK